MAAALSTMLRDRYYLGYVIYKGEEMQGRHEPLIDENLFDNVQEILESRANAHERRRVHHHYLKGSLFCGRCQRTGTVGRMIVQRTTNRHGNEYLYFFCRNKQKGTCTAPHINVALVEDAVEAHYATIRFRSDFITSIRNQIAEAINAQETADRLLQQQLTTELQALDAQEENLIDLAADATLPQPKIKAKLRDIAHQRRRLTERLATTTEDLSSSARLIDAALTLLENPQELYRRCNEHQRRLFNQAIFQQLYIDDEQINGHLLHEPFGQLHAAQRAQTGTCGATRHKTSRDAPKSGNARMKGGVGVLLQGIHSALGSSSDPMVGYLRRLSNLKSAGQGLTTLLAEARNESDQPRSRDLTSASPRRLRRLNEAERAALAQDYLGGKTVYELAEMYGISRDTVGKHLKRMGVGMRMQRLSEEQIDETVRLYGEGWSAQRIGDKLGVYPQTVRRRLLERGVRMRDTHGRIT
ncbi:recombinase zinc beta ribbon domain-containing protein [Nocardia cyriacigeorgica]|uniref:recombinase zinc beta ribbon domain-containing protein n=1 Tax=Nocardia cyriacigeorgica TaxID=135487 RepID=UPI0024589B28|nr:recombinase zinc beta ribbon domain-containing protein [Nocardia cyriacigeorgica]